MKKKLTLKTIISTTTLVLALQTPVNAGIPVVDIPRTITDIAEFLANVERWREQAKQFERQFGNKGNFGQFLNGALDKELRKYLPPDLVASIDAISTENYSATKLEAELIKIATELQRFKADLVFIDNPDTTIDESASQEAKTYQRRRSQTMLGMAVAEKAYNENERRLTEIDQLLDKIGGDGSEATETQKYSNELRNRMIGKTAVIQTEQLQIQALMLKTLTEQNNRTNEEEALLNQSTRAGSLDIFN